jgi:hypothetical protein
MVGFWCPASCVTVSTSDLLSSSGTGVNRGIRSWKKHLSEWARCQKAISGIYFTNKWRAETLQPGLEFDKFKPRLLSGIFKCISWLNGSFLGDDRGFLKEGVKTYQMATMSPLNLSSLFFRFHIYSLWITISEAVAWKIRLKASNLLENWKCPSNMSQT